MVTSPEELKIMSESKIVSKDPEAEVKKPISEKVRDKLSKSIFGEPTIK